MKAKAPTPAPSAAVSDGRAPSSLLAEQPHWLAQRRTLLGYQFREFFVLIGRGFSSLKSRGLRPTLEIVHTRYFPAALQPYALKLYDDHASAPPLFFPDGQPRASVVVPVHNQLDYTLRCLHALARSGDATSFEVIVVDDASSDASASVLPAIDGLRYLRNEHNLGFIGSCNAGAGLARGEFVVFLNNDTAAQPGWLDALLETFSSHPDTGLAGSKLVYPDGRLQEAGGIVFSDGSAANYGRGEDPTDPRFNFVREADYCSGAAIAIRLDLFHQLGGFDGHFRPAYYEDTDIAMRVRQHGLKVRYQPASVVVHYEGITAGTDVRQGVKSYQLSNQLKFAERWSAVLAALHPEPGALASSAANYRAMQRVLVIDSYTPTPDRDSGSVRMVELMRLLLEEGCAVSFFCQNLTYDAHYSSDLQQMGVQAWWRPWIRNVPSWLQRHGSSFDTIIVSRHYVLSPLLPILRQLAPQARIVFDTVDLHFLREQREAVQKGDLGSRLGAARTRKSELALVAAVDATWVVSSYERELLSGLVPDGRVDVVSNIHRIVADSPDFAQRQDLAFVGSFRHPPNVDAATWLVTEILPLVHTRLPDVRLHLVGADAPESVVALGTRPGVRFHGHVADLDALLDGTRISVAPLRYGAGIKGKINHSLARGLPVVATACAVEGMYLADGQAVLTADTAAGFADAIVRLYQDRALWEKLRAAGFENTQEYFSRETARPVIRDWLASLSATSPAPAATAGR